MDLPARVASDLTSAMKARDELKLSVLRMLKAEFQKARAEAGRSSLTDEDCLAIARRLIKQRREAAEQYESGGAVDRAKRELEEITVLEGYLPAQLDDAGLDALVEQAVKSSGASSPKDVGRLMSVLMPLVAGRADGKRVKEKALARLSA
ncbi:MAG: GatB/YqeY domain-containing protein [Synergistaceae bacterium]|nr:GatB/YqeY domain-containing protein [Synergistaceae bacterium]